MEDRATSLVKKIIFMSEEVCVVNQEEYCEIKLILVLLVVFTVKLEFVDIAQFFEVFKSEGRKRLL